MESDSMPETIQAEHRFSALEQDIYDLLEKCREVIKDSKDYIAQSQRVKEKSKQLLAAARDLRTR